MIEVRNTSRIRDLQAKFNELFPYLKLGVDTGLIDACLCKGPDTSPTTLNGYTVEDAGCFCKGCIWVEEDMTVEQLETAFKECFGCRVHVYRRSGNVWLQTNFTHQWTLREQNEMGQETS